MFAKAAGGVTSRAESVGNCRQCFFALGEYGEFVGQRCLIRRWPTVFRPYASFVCLETAFLMSRLLPLFRFSPFFLFGALSPLHAELMMPSIFSSGMVLQADRALPVWGWGADPGSRVVVTFAGGTVEAVANARGDWFLELQPQPVSVEPREMIVRNAVSVLRFEDVLVGEVWLFSGQSNMEFQLSKDAEREAFAALPLNRAARFFHVPRNLAEAPERDVEARWSVVDATTEETLEASSLALWFGRILARERGVPVGLIMSSWGGTPARAWTPQAAFATNPALGRILRSWKIEEMEFPLKKEAFEAQEAILWERWEADAGRAALNGEAPPPKPRLRTGPDSHYVPSVLYNGMIAPIVPFAIHGVVWYQGENDVWEPEDYARLLPAMMEGWRDAFAQPEQPWIVVQLPNLNRQSEAEAKQWPKLREAQAIAGRDPRVALAVTLDLGDPQNIHPGNKRHFAQRVWQAAEVLAFGAPPSSGLAPEVASCVWKEGEVVVEFSQVAGELSTSDGKSPREFEVLDLDGNWNRVVARIESPNTVSLSFLFEFSPVAVRYGWSDNPAVNLVDQSGLTAAPWRGPVTVGEAEDPRSLPKQTQIGGK